MTENDSSLEKNLKNENDIKDINAYNISNLGFNKEEKNETKSGIFQLVKSQNLKEEIKEEPIPSESKNTFLIILNKLKYKLKYFMPYINYIKENKYCKRYFLNKNDLIILAMNLISIISYNIGLMPCEKDPSECTIKHGLIFYVKIGVFTLLSAILYTIFIVITLYKCKHFLHYLYSLPVFIHFITTYHGAETVDHGLYNSIGWILSLILLVPLFLFTFVIFNLIAKKKYIRIGIIFSVILLIFMIYNNLPGFSCDYWPLGLNNTRINNDLNTYPCHILIPGKNKCYLKKFEGVFDLSKMMRPSCSAEKIIKNEKKIFINSLDKRFFGISKLNHFGYPITTVPDIYGFNSSKDLKEFQDLINHNIIKMDLYNKHNYPDQPYPEVEVFFDENNYGNIKINVTRNETLSRERKKIAENKASLYNNVLIIYLDALSRNHFLRKIHRLAKYIEPFMLYNLNEKEKPFTAFQFFKYNTLKGLTLPNIKPMFYGVNLTEPNGENIVKYFRENGFVTGHTGTTCGKEIFSVNSMIQSQKLDLDNWDHENIAMFCDENFFNSSYTLYKGVVSVLKRCLYGKYGFEYMIEYTKQFWEKYPDNKKFFRIHFNEGHEATMELVNYMADPLFDFVKYFFDNHLLNDTFIFILSDHGNHLPGPWTIIRPQDYVIESTLGTLFFVIPNSNKLYRDGLYDIIYKNQQIFITPYDIHDTLVHLAYGNKKGMDKYSKRGNSLLVDLDPMERYCESPKLDLNIAKSDCKCKRYRNNKQKLF